MAPFDRSHISSYWHSIVTMALSCIFSDTERDIGRKSRLFIHHLHSTPPLRGPRWKTAIMFGMENWNSWPSRRWRSLRICKLYSSRYSTRTWQTDRQKDGQTPHDCTGRALRSVTLHKQSTILYRCHRPCVPDLNIILTFRGSYGDWLF